DEPLPLLALRVLRAPVQPEERVAIDVAEQILDRQGLDVTRTEEGWIRDVDVARRPARRALCVHRLRLLLQRRALGDTLDHVAMPRARTPRACSGPPASRRSRAPRTRPCSRTRRAHTASSAPGPRTRPSARTTD